MRLFCFFSLFLIFRAASALGAEESIAGSELMKAVSKENPNAILCEKAGGEFVICEGIPYRKERSSSVNTTGRAVKLPHARKPAVIGPAEEDTKILPAE